MQEKKCPECGGLNGGHSNRRCPLMTLEYAQQEIINVEQKWLKVIATMNRNKDVVFNRLKTLITFFQGKVSMLKAENNKLRKKPQHPGSAGWVKASKFKYEVGISYCAKDEKSRGAGFFHKNGAFIWGDGSITHPRDQEDLLILDESPSKEGNKDREEEEDWIDVNDRLPYKDGDSSVYCLVNDTYDGVVVRPFNEAHECWDQEDGDDYYTDAKGGKITHWKPVPEPPKRKQK